MISESKQRAYYIGVDYISTSIALLLFNVVRYYCLPISNTSLSSFLLYKMLLIEQLIYPPIMLFIYYLSGYYNDVFTKSRISELTSTFTTALVGTLILIFGALINDLSNNRISDYSLFLILFSLFFIMVYVPRLIITWCTKTKIYRGDIYFNTAIVGYGSHPELFAQEIKNIDSVTGLHPVVMADADNLMEFDNPIKEIPTHKFSGIAILCQKYNLNRILVIPHPNGWERTMDVINELFALNMPIFIAAGKLPSYLFKTRPLSLTSEPVIDITDTLLPASTLNLKRMFDIILSLLAIIVTVIPLLFIALAIRLDSPGAAIFRQVRIGRHGKPFNIIKLRTMIANAEPEGTPQLSHTDDTRITRIGRFLRKYRIDELPQMWNVLRGDMSIVGPRPERPHFVKQIIARDPSYKLLRRVRPGITSLGMVKYGYASSVSQMVERMRYDLVYLNNISMVTDLKVILHTIRTVFSGKGI